MDIGRVLVIEDDPTIADFLATSLRQTGYLVDLASDGDTGLQLALKQDYVVLIVDLMLPGRNGLAIIAGLRAKPDHTPIIILSAKHTVADRVRGLEIGADDYLTKPFSFSELLARLQAVLRRSNAIIGPIDLTVADLTLDLLGHKVSRSGHPIELRPNEYDLLEYLMRNSGQVVSKAAIVRQIWGYDFDPGTNLVDVLVCRLRAKIDRDYNFKLLHTIRGLGYVLRQA